jgi:hypothetical protein
LKRVSNLCFERFPIAFPAVTKPVWSGKVDRWYQLDAAAYGLAQACFQWRQMAAEPPSFIVLASRGASNDADRAFVESGADSPAKFVHTLPSVRSSTFCQVMDWHGPMLCLQEDPSTLCVALVEAVKIVCEDVPVVWVLSTWREGSVFSVMRLSVTHPPPPGAGIHVLEEGLQAEMSSDAWLVPADRQMLTWLEDSNQHSAPFALFEGITLIRKQILCPDG